MKTVDIKDITRLVRELCIRANYELPCDIRQAFENGRKQEQSSLGQEIFDKMLLNCDKAKANEVPICQDTGMAVVFIDLGQEVHIAGGLLEDAVNEGVRQGYRDGYLRCSVVGDPLRRINTDDNTPAIIYVHMVAGDEMHITVAPKGFGSENMSAMKMFTPAANRQDIVDFVVDAVCRAGSNPCPPVIIGVGLGGTSDKAACLAKRALMRPINVKNQDLLYADMEEAILRNVNALGIGPQGLGGTVTALSCAVEPYATHIAGLPCVVNIGCHVTRHAEGVL